MTDAETNERFEELYLQFTLLQGRDVLRKTGARLAALPVPILYPELRAAFIPQRKRAAVESVLAVCRKERPDVTPAVHWFRNASQRDLEIHRECSQSGGGYHDLYECLYNDGPLFGLAEIPKGLLWLHAALDDQALVDTTAHEFFHFANPAGSEADAIAFGRKAAGLLCPHGRGALFFTEEHRYSAKAGDSILVPHGDRQWVRILHRDGSLEWHRPLQPFELFVASNPYVYQ